MALMLALGCGACSLSPHIENLGAGGADTGSLKAAPASGLELETLPPADLIYVRAAAAEVLQQGEKDASLPWENPGSGARGTVTPIASAYVEEGKTCHNFLVSYLAGTVASWMQGQACQRDEGAPWEVRSLKPWQQS